MEVGRIERGWVVPCVGEGWGHDLIGFDANHDIGFSFEQGFYGVYTEATSEDAVESTRDAAALGMTEDGDANTFEV